MKRDTDNSPSSVLDRVHELVAASIRTHPSIDARAALRVACVEIENLKERLIYDAAKKEH